MAEAEWTDTLAGAADQDIAPGVNSSRWFYIKSYGLQKLSSRKWFLSVARFMTKGIVNIVTYGVNSYNGLMSSSG